jgi:hypothetical protein
MHKDCNWLTAKVADPIMVRRCIGRLDLQGYEYRVVPDDRQLRILVRREQLDRVLELLGDSTVGMGGVRQIQDFNNHLPVRLLVSIPIGAAFGSIVAAQFETPPTFISFASAICACIAAWLSVAIMQRRDGCG